MTTEPKKWAAVKVMVAEFEAGATSSQALPGPTVDEVAFVGRSNVGKSSVMNALLERRSLVRTSSTPGCTRQINLFAVTLVGGRTLRLVDLPGYGYAKLSKTERASWGALLEGYIQTRTTLRAVALVIDARRGFEDDDAQMTEFLLAPRPCGPPPRLVLVATKLDKIALSKQKPVLAKLEKDARRTVLGFSAVTGEGRGGLWAAVFHATGASGEAASLASSSGVE
jgi:GTP-binding protein